MSNVSFFFQNGGQPIYNGPNLGVSAQAFIASHAVNLCSSGNCLSDCREPGSMYGNITQVSDDNSTSLYSICYALPNLTRQIYDGSITSSEANDLTSFFPQTTECDLETLTTTATQGLTDSCSASRYPDRCLAAWSASHLLINSTSSSIAGQLDCLEFLCSSDEFLPFANQDIIGIGVSQDEFSICFNY